MHMLGIGEYRDITDLAKREAREARLAAQKARR